MTDAERTLFVEKCARVLQAVVVEIRMLSYEAGHEKQINDLADVVHNVPLYLIGRDEFVAEYIRGGLLDHARQFHPEYPPEAYYPVMILDMDEASFTDLYRRTTWDWPSSQPTPSTAGAA